MVSKFAEIRYDAGIFKLWSVFINLYEYCYYKLNAFNTLVKKKMNV